MGAWGRDDGGVISSLCQVSCRSTGSRRLCPSPCRDTHLPAPPSGAAPVPPQRVCHSGAGGEISARNNRVEYRTGLNGRKYVQIIKSMARQQGCGGGPARGQFVASPGAGAGLQFTPSNFVLSQHLPACKGALQLSAERITQKRFLYSRRVKKCQCCPFLR